jgi:drug/metabolite transporter (DMT)-like permease
MSRRGWILFLLLCAIWGLPYLMIRIAVREIDPATLVFLRTAPVALVLLPWAAWTGRLGPLRKVFGWLALYSVCEFGIPWLLMSSAEKHLTSSLTALLVAGVPMMGALLYRFTHVHEPIGAKRATGLVIGTLGVAALVGLSIEGSTWVGIAEMVPTVLGYTLGPLIIATRLKDMPGLGVVGASVGLVALAYLPYGVTNLPSHVSISALGAVCVLAVVCTGAGFLTFFALILEVGPSRATVVTYVNPAVAIALGVAVLGEPLTLGMVLGFPMIVLGSILATSRTSVAEDRANTDRSPIP